MTNKDMLKILLCTYGYDRNIKIGINRVDEGFIEYDIYGEHKDGDYYHEVDCDSFTCQIYKILDYMKQFNMGFKSDWWGASLKELCDDETRNSLIELQDKKVEDHKKWCIAYKPIEEWNKENHPCPNCTINKKDHWDSIHYNCELNHNHSCEIMIKHYEKLTEMTKAMLIDI